MRTLSRHCPKCNQYGQIELIDNLTSFNCPTCQEPWGEIKNKNDIFDYCPCCPSRQFYITKDFNQLLGCIIILIGIVLVPATYGLSLPFLALIDWLLHKKAAFVITCYRCGTEFRGMKNYKDFKPFMHHIGIKYDKYR